MIKKEPFLWEGVEFVVRSPEGGTTIEQFPGATIETSREVAQLLESAATSETTYSPPTVEEVLACIAMVEAEKS